MSGLGSMSHRGLSRRARLLLGLGSFALPLLLWCAVSYLPWLWHPQVLITDVGNPTVAGEHAYLRVGQRVSHEELSARNRELASAGATPARGEPVNPVYLPAPHEVARAIYDSFFVAPRRPGDQWLHESLWQSCQVIFWGFTYSAMLGLPLGLLAGCFSSWSRVIEPFVDFIRYMPAPVFGVLAVAVFGLGAAPKVSIVFIGTFFQMVLIVANTTRQLDIALVEVARTLGANSRQLLLSVVIPVSLPKLYRDMRILLGWAWTFLVVAELIGEKSGISAFIDQQQRHRHFDRVYAAIIVIGLVGLICDRLLAAAEHRLFPWAEEPET